MLKLLGATIIVFTCGYMGLSVARKYQNRPRDLATLQNAIQMLETEISYGATPMPDALEQVARRSVPSIAPLFLTTRVQLLNGKGTTVREAWQEGLMVLKKSSAVNQNDVSILQALGGALGISDRRDQVKHLTLAREQLKNSMLQAEEEARKYVKLYNYLGFLSGLTIVLILV